jgi:toluene monooxygenase system protein B
MEKFPLVINFQGDYGMKVMLVNADSTTIGDVARIAADELVGVVVKPLPAGTALLVRKHGTNVDLDNKITIANAGLVRMEALDIVHG